jgi:protein-S-isoprenylcysteine O-methyltransferase Ste14
MATLAISPILAFGRDFAVRLFASMWFLFLAAFVGWGTFGDLTSAAWQQTAYRICLIVFYVLLWWLILSRPLAQAQTPGILPKLAAFTGTYLPWCITFVARDGHPIHDLASTICLLVGSTLMVVSVAYLGRSFSLVPQSRRLVQTGPYRYVRHPLYLAEEIAVVGVVLQIPSVLTFLILVTHVGIQVSRIFYEERLLSQTLSGYDRYAMSRWRLVPFVW